MILTVESLYFLYIDLNDNQENYRSIPCSIDKAYDFINIYRLILCSVRNAFIIGL